MEAYVTFGSNIDPEFNVPEACSLLLEAVTVSAVSSVYRTKALDRPEQPDYCNGALKIATSLAARELKFDVLRDIEARLGRARSADRFASRPIDLDIALFGDLVIDEADLVVPDPDIRTRPFVAVPLLELSPDLRLPDTGETLETLTAAGMRDGLVKDEGLTERLRTRLGL